MGKPSYIGWIPDNATGIATPPPGKLTTGWVTQEKPPYQWMNWLFNLTSQWINLLGPRAYDVVVGAGSNCTHATLPAAVADSAVGTNVRVFVQDSVAALNATVNLTKAGWIIEFGPGVTYTNGTAGTCFSMQASGIEVRGGRFSGFTTAILAAAGWTYGRVLFCNFVSCTTEIDDTLAPALKKPVAIGNITE